MIAASILDRAKDSLGESLPGIAGAVLLLVFGLLVAAVVGRVTERALRSVGLDELAERFGVHDAIARIGVARSISRLLGRAVRIALAVVFVIAAVSMLGLGALEESLNEAVLFLPKLFVALLLVLAGAVLGTFIGRRVDRLADQMDVALPVGRAAEGVVIALFTLTALAQIGVPTSILTVLVGMMILAVALTLALAFGLGGRDVARQMSAGRYVGGAFELGQRITVANVSGEIVAIESAATVVRANDGRIVRVPNQLLLESIVTVDDGVADGSIAPPPSPPV